MPSRFHAHRLILTVALALVSAIAVAAGGCSSGQKPTPAQCDATHAVAIESCAVFASNPDERAKCLAAANLARLVCLVWAEQPAEGSRAVKSTNTRAARLAEVYGLAAVGGLSPEAATAYVLGGSDGPR